MIYQIHAMTLFDELRRRGYAPSAHILRERQALGLQREEIALEQEYRELVRQRQSITDRVRAKFAA